MRLTVVRAERYLDEPSLAQRWKSFPTGNKSYSVTGCDNGSAVRGVPQLRAREALASTSIKIDGIVDAEPLEHRSTGQRPKKRPAMFANGALRYAKLGEHKY